jgi:hypothetical protein
MNRKSSSIIKYNKRRLARTLKVYTLSCAWASHFLAVLKLGGSSVWPVCIYPAAQQHPIISKTAMQRAQVRKSKIMPFKRITRDYGVIGNVNDTSVGQEPLQGFRNLFNVDLVTWMIVGSYTSISVSYNNAVFIFVIDASPRVI